MAGQPQSTQRCSKAARRAARRGGGVHAKKDVSPSIEQAPAHNPSVMLPDVSPEQARPEISQPGTAPALAPRPLAGADAPKGKSSKTRRVMAFSSAMAVTIVIAVTGISGESPKESPPPPLAQTSAQAGIAEAIPTAPVKQKAQDTRNNGQVKKVATSQTKAPTKAGTPPASARADKQGTPVKPKNQTTKVAKAPKKSESTPQAAPASQQDGGMLASKAPAAQNRYAQCLELPGFLRREQCKWQACSDKWGQDGCPSYARDDGEVNS